MDKIFIKQVDNNYKNNNTVTYTDVLKMIPKHSGLDPINDWREKGYKTEWRWRFFEDDSRRVVEISYLNRENDSRVYFDKNGNWVKSEDNHDYDELLMKEYYAYTH